MKRSDILDTAKEYISKNRNTSYGEPEGNFQNIANLWNSYLIAKCGVCTPKLTAEDVGIMMTLLKVARMASGNKEDNYIDAAGYIACAGEIATEEKPKQTKGDYTPIKTYFSTEPIILDGPVCIYKPASRDEMDLFWHDVLTSNGDID